MGKVIAVYNMSTTVPSTYDSLHFVERVTKNGGLILCGQQSKAMAFDSVAHAEDYLKANYKGWVGYITYIEVNIE